LEHPAELPPSWKGAVRGKRKDDYLGLGVRLLVGE
jgi:hypothetical protein